jgi:hypothetical protein
MSDPRGALREQAETLRLVASQLAGHGVGSRWQGGAKDECEKALHLLEDDLRSLARRVDTAADAAGVHSVWADM